MPRKAPGRSGARGGGSAGPDRPRRCALGFQRLFQRARPRMALKLWADGRWRARHSQRFEEEGQRAIAAAHVHHGLVAGDRAEEARPAGEQAVQVRKRAETVPGIPVEARRADARFHPRQGGFEREGAVDDVANLQLQNRIPRAEFPSQSLNGSHCTQFSLPPRPPGWLDATWRRLSACRLDTRVESCAPPATSVEKSLDAAA